MSASIRRIRLLPLFLFALAFAVALPLLSSTPPEAQAQETIPAPTNLKVTRSDGKLHVSWSSHEHHDWYHITYSGDNKQSWQAAATDYTSTGIVIGNADNTKTYYVAVRARGQLAGGGYAWSGWTNSSEIAAYDSSSPLPLNLTITADSNNLYSADWDDYSGDFSHYWIAWFKGDTDSGVNPISAGNAGKTSKTTLTLTESGTYLFRVQVLHNGNTVQASYLTFQASLSEPTPTPTPTPMSDTASGQSDLSFDKPYATYVFYEGVAADQNLPTASSTTTGTITYTISPTPDNGITFTAATPKLSASTSTAIPSDKDYTFNTYTLTATKGSSTATIKIGVGVIDDVCTANTGWHPENSDGDKTPAVPGAGLIRDCNILLAVKDTLEGDDGSLDWSKDKKMTGRLGTPLSWETWDGINTGKFTADGITTLSLSSNNVGATLEGKLPPLLAAMSKMKHIKLSGNQLTGSMPPGLSGMESLERLELQWNKLSGSIPADLGRISTLTYLDLSNNRLTGGIPTALGSLSALKRLNLSCAQTGKSDYAGLGGTIPTQIGNLTNLERLYLKDCGLTGSIPADDKDTSDTSDDTGLAKLTKLQFLFLDGNSLSGSIPQK